MGDGEGKTKMDTAGESKKTKDDVRLLRTVKFEKDVVKRKMGLKTQPKIQAFIISSIRL